MTPSEKQNYFSIIEEHLEASNMVTFKWLSRKHNIHSTIAKQILSEFINDSDKNKYSATYLLFGEDKEGRLVINLSNENAGNEDDSITVVDKQIYSIENNSSEISIDELYNEDKLTFQLEQINLSSINYPSKITKKPNLRRMNAATTSSNKETNEGTSSIFSKSAPKAETKKDKCNKLGFTALPKIKSDEKSVNKTIEKSPSKIVAKTETEPKVNNNKVSKHARGTLSSLFQNHRVKNHSGTVSATSKEDDQKSQTNDTLESKIKLDSSETTKQKNVLENQPVERTSSVKSVKKQTNTKKNSSKPKKKTEKKKRKRITSAFESSSDENASDAESRDEESPFDQIEVQEPEPETEKPIEPIPDTITVQGKKRKRKLIEKSGLVEGGFLYTSKEIVYESCDSDDNDENDPKTNQDSNKRQKTNESECNSNAVISKTKAVSPSSEKDKKNPKAKTKQASIMNFFKKS